MQTNTQIEQAPATYADMVKRKEKIQFHHIGIDHYPLMPHNGIFQKYVFTVCTE